MKKILLTFISALTFCGVHSQWINQNLPPITYDSYMYDVQVVDANTVWAAQQDGASTVTQYTKDFVRTTDGGNTWTFGSVAGSPAANVICNIWPVSATDCYVSMFGASPALGGVWKTTDGGTTWNEVGTNMFTAATSFPDVVYFWDTQNGMAMGDPVGNPLKYEIYLTHDAGATWVQVPPANLPALTNAAEFGITNLFSHADGYIWFGTTYGDVYRSVDGGNNWTKSATGFPPFNTGTQEQDISDIAFSDSLHGLAIQIDATPAVLMKQTSDGGLTWVDVIPSGIVYGSDIEAVRGTTTGVFVSSGSSAAFGFGTTVSTDNGLTWADLDVNISHTGLDFLDANTGWSGEFIAANSSAGGAWKFTGIPVPVPCGSPTVSPGSCYINPYIICWLDTLVVTTTGVVAPTDGATHGFSLLVSTADISGNNDVGTLVATGVVIGGTGVIVGSTIPATSLINDASIFPTGIYYFTPVVYGNATGTGNVTQLTFDINCTNTGTSVMVNLLAQGDPLCATSGIGQNNASSFGIKSIYPVPAKDNVNIVLNAKVNGVVTVSVKDLIGREVFSNQFSTVKGENNLVLDLSKQSAGVYVISVTGNESTAVSKFVKE